MVAMLKTERIMMPLTNPNLQIPLAMNRTMQMMSYIVTSTYYAMRSSTRMSIYKMMDSPLTALTMARL